MRQPERSVWLLLAVAFRSVVSLAPSALNVPRIAGSLARVAHQRDPAGDVVAGVSIMKPHMS